MTYPMCGCVDSCLTSLYYNNIVVNMIPCLTSLPGAPWDVLPAGIHTATFSEVEATFAINAVRRELFAGLLDAAISLRGVGCVKLYLDGSYVTGKPIPGDYDACWDPVGVDLKKLDPVFRDFSNKRQAQKAKFKGEFFPSTMKNAPTQPFVDFFQVDRFTGLSKGILLILLGADPVLLGRLAP
jgi:hypothetical protein